MRNLRFVVIGDIHGGFEAVEKAKKYIEEKSPDAVLICGDLTHLGGKKEAQRIIEALATERIPVLYVCMAGRPSLEMLRLWGSAETLGAMIFSAILKNPKNP